MTAPAVVSPPSEPAPDRRPPTSWPAALSLTDRAVVAMAGTLLAVWMLTWITPLPFPPESVAEWIMARTPPALANALLTTLGRLAQPFALLGGFACYLALAVLTGTMRQLLQGRHRASFWRLLSPLGAMATAAGLLVGLLRLPLAGNLVLVSVFAALWTGLEWRALRQPRQSPDGAWTRRRALKGMALAAGAVLVSANVVFVGAAARAYRGVRLGGERLFAWTPPPARAEGFEIDGLSSEVTPVESFYRMSKNVRDPEIAADGWRLRLHGLTASTLTITYADLLALPRRDIYVTQRCVSNGIADRLMSTALFSGPSLATLLERAGVTGAASTVVFRSPDGHTDSLDLGRALLEDTIIAYAMNGRALTHAHGYPVRLLAPGLYGFKSVKWLTEIEVIAGTFSGTWQALGWTATARVKTMARVDTAPLLSDGRRNAAGVAFAGDRGIGGVEVRADGGAWKPATLHIPPLSRLTWVQWRAEIPSDARAVTVRAIDGDGAPQDERPADQFPDGAQGLHTFVILG